MPGRDGPERARGIRIPLELQGRRDVSLPVLIVLRYTQKLRLERAEPAASPSRELFVRRSSRRSREERSRELVAVLRLLALCSPPSVQTRVLPDLNQLPIPWLALPLPPPARPRPPPDLDRPRDLPSFRRAKPTAPPRLPNAPP